MEDGMQDFIIAQYHATIAAQKKLQQRQRTRLDAMIAKIDAILRRN